MTLPPGITIDPFVRSGQPRVRNTRIAVVDVLEYLAGGETVEQLFAHFPDLTREDVRACLAMGAASVKTQHPPLPAPHRGGSP